MLRISPEELEKINIILKENKSKHVKRLLKVLILRAEGKSNLEISKETGYNKRYIMDLFQKYKKYGLTEYVQLKWGGHNRKLSEDEEAKILKEFERQISEGKVLTMADIRKAFKERLGEDSGCNYVYRILARHGWHKAMPPK